MPWLKQLILFLIAWFFVKLVVVLAVLLIPIFTILANLILSPLQNDEKAQIIFVMFIFPLCMNIIQGI
jgi:hypothetical protein